MPKSKIERLCKSGWKANQDSVLGLFVNIITQVVMVIVWEVVVCESQLHAIQDTTHKQAGL